MEAPSPPLRSHRTVVTSVVAAALAVTALSMVGIASLLGWLPERQKASFIPPDQRKGENEPAPRAPRDALAPIEAGPHGDPLMPRYSRPEPPPPAPEFGNETPPPRAPVHSAAAPRVAPAPPPAPEPEPPRAAPVPREPSYASGREPREPSYAMRPVRGRVAGISYRGGTYEVRVRFEDGSSQAFRYRNRPVFEPGERVRLEGDFLESD